MTKIEKELQLEETINYENTEIKEFWEGNNIENLQEKVKDAFSGTKLNFENNLDAVIKNDISNLKDSTICLMLEEIPTELLETINKLSQNNNIYIIFPDSILNDKDQKMYINNLTNVLIRYSENPLGDICLINPKSSNGSGFIITGKNNNQKTGWVYKIDGETLKEVFHFFVYMFWMECYEYINKEKVYSTPSDIPKPLSPKHIIYNTNDFKLLEKEMKKTPDMNHKIEIEYILSSEINIKNFTYTKFLDDKNYSSTPYNWKCITSKDNAHNDNNLFNGLYDEKIQVYSTDENIKLFNCTISNSEGKNEGFIFLKPFDREEYILDLAIKLDGHTINAIENNQNLFQNWFYRKNSSIKDIKKQIFKREYKKPLSIIEKKNSKIEAKNIQSIDKKKDEFKIDIPKEMPEIARQITYSQKINMPMLPKEAAKDIIYSIWEKFRDNVINHKNKLTKILPNNNDLNELTDERIKQIKTTKEGQEIINKINPCIDKAKSHIDELVKREQDDTKSKREELLNKISGLEKILKDKNSKDKEKKNIEKINKKLDENKSKIKEIDDKIEKIREKIKEIPEKEALSKSLPKENYPELPLYYQKKDLTHFIIIEYWEDIDKAMILQASHKNSFIVITSQNPLN